MANPHLRHLIFARGSFPAALIPQETKYSAVLPQVPEGFSPDRMRDQEIANIGEIE